MPFLRAIVVATLLFATSTAGAQALVRDAAALEQMEIQGISLSMTAEEAFETLRAAGFQAGTLNTYADWDSAGIEFVRGTYGSPEGYSSLVMIRNGDRITKISETYNAPGSPLDANAEIGSVKRQLGLPDDSNRCRTNGTNNGSCQVQDAEASEDVTVHYGLQVLSTMRIAIVMRPKEQSL